MHNQHFFEFKDQLIFKEKIRIDKIIFDHYSKNIELSRSKISEAIKSGNVKINGEICNDPSKKYDLINSINIIIGAPKEIDLTPKLERSFEIIYEDEHLMVINKPAGITVHPGAGNYNDTLVNELLGYSKSDLSQIGGEFRPGIVHRLDKDTSGIMMIAKTDFAHSHLGAQLKTRELSRIYYAICYGLPQKMRGIIQNNIGRDPVHRQQMKVVEDGGKLAITEYEVVKSIDNANLSLIKCSLKTGRTHQIRVHMTHMGHSIIGDPVYKSRGISRYKNSMNKELRNIVENLTKQALHAHSIKFIHPKTLEEMSFSTETPELMTKILRY